MTVKGMVCLGVPFAQTRDIDDVGIKSRDRRIVQNPIQKGTFHREVALQTGQLRPVCQNVIQESVQDPIVFQHQEVFLVGIVIGQISHRDAACVCNLPHRDLLVASGVEKLPTRFRDQLFDIFYHVSIIWVGRVEFNRYF